MVLYRLTETGLALRSAVLATPDAPMTAFELPATHEAPRSAGAPAAPSAVWLRAAVQAERLAWASLAWMGFEGVAGVLAGIRANSLGVVT